MTGPPARPIVADLPAYLVQPNCMTVGGSWVVPKEALAARDWPAIEALARQAAGFAKI